MSEQETIETLQGQISALRGAKEVAEDNLARVNEAFTILIGRDIEGELTVTSERLDTIENTLNDLQYKIDNLEDESDMVDEVCESMTFQSAVEEITREEVKDMTFRVEVS